MKHWKVKVHPINSSFPRCKEFPYGALPIDFAGIIIIIFKISARIYPRARNFCAGCQTLKNTDNIPKGKGDEDFDSLLRSTKKKVMLGETIAFESGKSNLTVINVQVPRKDKMNDPWYPYEYMSWLDGLSHVERPSLLVHGSNVDCLTFYS